MTEPAVIPAYLDGLFPKADEATLRLLAAAVEQGGFLACDLHALRDLLELSGYRDRPAAFGLILAMMAALDDGSLCVEATATALTKRLSDLAGPEAPDWAARILAELDASRLPALVGPAEKDERPILLQSSGGRRFLYFQRHLRCEREFHAAFLQRLQATPPPPPQHIGDILDDVLRRRPVSLAGRPLQLDVDQQAAVGLGLWQNLLIVSGGPGTGKTSIVFTLLRCLARLGLTANRIALAAPTGRAAQRLSDALQSNLAHLGERAAPADLALQPLKPTTLHQLLGYLPSSGQFRRHQENPIAADLVIVDEVSMVGIELMAKLFQAVRPDARLVLLGDKDQLPSVDAGAVLAHLLPERAYSLSQDVRTRLADWFGQASWPWVDGDQPLCDKVVMLRTNHRSQPAIREAAQAINEQDAALAERLPALAWPVAEVAWPDLVRAGGCWLWQPTSPTSDELHKILERWARHAFLDSDEGVSFADDLNDCRIGPYELGAATQSVLERLFARLERFRLLTLLREGSWGAQRINDYLAHVVRGRLDRHAGGPLFAGAPVLITRNDHVRQLFNGDVGLAVCDTDGGRRVVFRRQHQFVSFPAESLPPHELGFALTVHKSQGSEYNEVLVVLPPEAGRRLLTKELVYTAVTRAKQLAILCGTQDTLRYAISRKIVREAGVLRF